MPYVRLWVEQDYEWRGVLQEELVGENHNYGIQDMNPSLTTGSGFWTEAQVSKWEVESIKWVKRID
jgi:hypothetical protein